MGASNRRDADSSSALLLGAILDGIPESVVIGITLLAGGEVGLAFPRRGLPLEPAGVDLIVARNVRAGQSVSTFLGRWAWWCSPRPSRRPSATPLEDASDDAIGLIQAFAGGAVLTMLADTCSRRPTSHPAA